MRDKICLYWPARGDDVSQITHWAEELDLDLALIDALDDLRERMEGCIGAILSEPSLPDDLDIGALTRQSQNVVVVSLAGGEGAVGNALRRHRVPYIWGRGLKGCRWALRLIANRVRHPPDITLDRIGADVFCRARRATMKMIVVLHGGFWRPQFTRDITHEFAAMLAHHDGILVCNLDYPSLFDAPSPRDVAESMIRTIGELFSYLSDLYSGAIKDIFVAGHSAGGFFALGLAGEYDAHFRRAGLPLAGVIAISAVSDLDCALSDKLGNNVLQELREHRRDFSIASHSPIALAGYRVPILLIHGEQDDTVPFDYSLAFQRRHADYATLVPIRLGSHMNVTRKNSPVIDQVLTCIFSFANGNRSD